MGPLLARRTVRARVRQVKGLDGGCFAAALIAVRRFGGVLEHPEASSAWREFGLAIPPKMGGWIKADEHGGFTCCVEQGHYGHRARKATWLYVSHVALLPDLKWGPSASCAKLDLGFHSAEERRQFMRPSGRMSGDFRLRRRAWLEQYAQATGKELMCPERMNKRERSATPTEFRDLLLSIARTAESSQEWRSPIASPRRYRRQLHV